MTSIQRRSDWPERLQAFIESRRSQPFAWGENDCCTFAADAIIEMTDTDLAVGLRGYRTAAEAARIIEREGGMATLAAKLPTCQPGFAQRGDIALVDMAGRPSFTVICWPRICCGPGTSGLVFVPLQPCIAVFKV